MSRQVFLSNAQQNQFQQQGFLVLENALPKQQIAALKAAALQIVDDFDIDRHRTVFSTRDRDAGRDDYFFDSAQNIHCFLEEDALDENGLLVKPPRLAINKIGHAMHDLNPVFSDFCRQHLFGALARSLGYQQAVLWQTMYIFKQPHIGGEVRWHQDASYLISATPGVTGIWVAIEDANRANGCLWVQAGGHRSPLREIYQVDWSRRQGELTVLDKTPWPGSNEAIALEVTAGSVVLFHERMPHYSSQNHSDFSRHAFTLHIAEAGAAWSSGNWLQRAELDPFVLQG